MEYHLHSPPSQLALNVVCQELLRLALAFKGEPAYREMRLLPSG